MISHPNINGVSLFLCLQLIRGSDPVEIRSPPIVQVSLDVAVTIDQFFLTNLIKNLAFVLKIDFDRIRIVDIVEEGSHSGISRRSLSSAATNSSIVTLEFGDPPKMNISQPESAPVSPESMTETADDSVEIEVRERMTFFPLFCFCNS